MTALRTTHPLAMFAAGVLSALAVFLVISVFSGGSDTGKTGETTPAKPAPPPAVEVGRSKLGRILTDANGRTLYLFNEDKRGHSHCYGACARVWPPMIVTGRPTAGKGLSADKLTTTKRRDSKLQLVYNGHPLYRMNADTKPGEMEGEGFLGTWWVVSPAGRQIVAPGQKVSKGGY